MYYLKYGQSTRVAATNNAWCRRAKAADGKHGVRCVIRDKNRLFFPIETRLAHNGQTFLLFH